MKSSPSPILGRTSAGHPKNLESARPYRGVNVFLLAFSAYAHGYGSSYRMTFNQATICRPDRIMML
jgi:antirestriction protein ArdC